VSTFDKKRRGSQNRLSGSRSDSWRQIWLPARPAICAAAQLISEAVLAITHAIYLSFSSTASTTHYIQRLDFRYFSISSSYMQLRKVGKKKTLVDVVRIA